MAGTSKNLEKLIFLFPRKAGLSREEFFAHYLDVHAPLGLELTRTMVHYTVNLRDRDGDALEGVDAITETWTGSVADFMNPDRSFATPEDAQRLMADHDSFIAWPYDAYAVDEVVRKGVDRIAPTDGTSTGGKVVVALADGEAAERLASLQARDEVTRLVENRVVTPLMTSAFGPVRAFVEVWLATDDALAPEIEELVGRDGAVYRVSEHVKK